jgi:hypothetical protein
MVRHRERYSMQITCPQCGKGGRIVWAESRPLWTGSGSHCAPKLLFSGFHTGPGTDRASNPMVYCDGCDAPTGLLGATGRRYQRLEGSRQLTFA